MRLTLRRCSGTNERSITVMPENVFMSLAHNRHMKVGLRRKPASGSIGMRATSSSFCAPRAAPREDRYARARRLGRERPAGSGEAAANGRTGKRHEWAWARRAPRRDTSS